MKLNRVENAKKNIIFGLIWRLYITIMPFVIRTIFIYKLGVEYLGLDGLFVSILNVLSLAELGVGSALVYHMYRAIASDDKNLICSLMGFYKKCYRIIGFVVLAVGLCIIPVLKFIVKEELPNDINIYILYLIQLFATTISYWLFAYKNCLLNAFQRNDLISKVNILVLTFQYALQIIILLTIRNYYIYISVVPLINILKNIATAIVVQRLYPEYVPDKNLDSLVKKDIFIKVKALLYSKIGAIIVSSGDTIVITSFLGLTMSGIYSNYHYILTAVIGFIAIIFESMVAGIGNSLELETNERIYQEYKTLSFLNDWIIMWTSCCLLCLFQPFIEIWLGKDYLLEFVTVCLIVIFYYFWKSNNVMLMYKDAKGLWHEDRFRPLIVGIVNLVMDILLVQYLGINGVVIASIGVYVFIAIPWLFYNVHKHIFNNSPKEMIIKFLLNLIASCVICAFTYFLCSLINFNFENKSIYFNLLFKLLICIIVPNLIYIIINIKNREMKNLKKYFR